ncbi:MAG: hypothetical protein HYU64_16415 [Armatimonadetes bacterium]|nr:hypothetical protein [Armatimonadota bacterium]
MAATIEGYSSSEEFAAKVNRAVSPPKADETEDEYVERAKKEIKRILLQKLG